MLNQIFCVILDIYIHYTNNGNNVNNIKFHNNKYRTPTPFTIDDVSNTLHFW